MKKKKGLVMKYFVLKPKGSDKYAYASRFALQAYAVAIGLENKVLAKDLFEWAKEEEIAAKDLAKAVGEK